MKKLLVLLVLGLFLVTGCDSEPQQIERANGDSLTYLFFKDKYEESKYYFEFLDRNTAKNDSTKIIMARNDDKYYYEINGSSNMIVIQKDGIRYTLDSRMKTYFKEDIVVVEDFSLGILPSNMDDLKTKGYETGKEKILDQNLRYERYTYDTYTSTYYFKGDDLVYIKEVTPLKTVVLKYSDCKDSFKKRLFDIPDSYTEMTY